MPDPRSVESGCIADPSSGSGWAHAVSASERRSDHETIRFNRTRSNARQVAAGAGDPSATWQDEGGCAQGSGSTWQTTARIRSPADLSASPPSKRVSKTHAAPEHGALDPEWSTPGGQPRVVNMESHLCDAATNWRTERTGRLFHVKHRRTGVRHPRTDGSTCTTGSTAVMRSPG